jgi:hypothetical protein
MQLGIETRRLRRGFARIFSITSDYGIDKQIMPLYSFFHDV